MTEHEVKSYVRTNGDQCAWGKTAEDMCDFLNLWGPPSFYELAGISKADCSFFSKDIELSATDEGGYLSFEFKRCKPCISRFRERDET